MNYPITDLKLEVQEAILDHPETRKHGIEVLDDNGVITLTGSVPSREISDTAEQIVEKLRNVVSVINQLDVRPKTEIRSDTLGPIK